MGVAWPKSSDSGEGIATFPSGEARIGPGAHSGGVQPRFSLRSRRRARLHGRCRAEAERCRRGRSLSPSGEARIGQGAYLGGVLPRFSLRGRRRARRQGRRMVEAERLRRGRSLSPPGEARVGPGAHSGGALPRFSLRGRRRGRAARASPGRSSAGEGPASPCPANPESGREPTRVGSGPDSACAARGALGWMGVAGSKPSNAGEGAASSVPGEGRVWPGAHSGGVRPRLSLCCRRRARL